MPFDPVACVAALKPWDVVYPFDNLVDPRKHKMWVCVSSANLWFLRINTSRYRNICVELSSVDHSFLAHDSFLGCGGDLIALSDAELEYLLGEQRDSARQGIIGVVHSSVRPSVCAAIRHSPRLSPYQISRIISELGCP